MPQTLPEDFTVLEEHTDKEQAVDLFTVPEEHTGEERAGVRHEGPPVTRCDGPLGDAQGAAGALITLPATRLPECLPVLRAAFATEVNEFRITAENSPSNPAFWTADDLAQAASRASRVLGAEVAGRLVGCAFVGRSPSRPGVAVLRHLAVLPEARHQGFGEALVQAAAEHAASQGARTLRIGIVAANHRLADWYQSLGFHPVETDVSHPNLGFTVDHLELTLTNAADG